MARGESSFQGTLGHNGDIVKQGRLSQVGFVLRIRKFLKDDNGNIVGEYEEDEFKEESILPEFEFGSFRHRKYIARRLWEVGCAHNRPRLRRMLDVFFANMKLILGREKEKNSESHTIPRTVLCVKKFVRWEDYLEARALELSMQEAPKPVPATKESIQALQKVKLEGDSTEVCMICMDQLSSGTDQVTSMPCSHLFHEDCIKEWQNTSHQCPLCRFPMPTDATP